MGEGITRARLVTALGWICGGVTALMVNYLVFYIWGEGYPVQPTSFIAFILGAFGGMAIADRLGEKGFRAMGLATGIVVAVALMLGVLLAR